MVRAGQFTWVCAAEGDHPRHQKMSGTWGCVRSVCEACEDVNIRTRVRAVCTYMKLNGGKKKYCCKNLAEFTRSPTVVHWFDISQHLCTIQVFHRNYPPPFDVTMHKKQQ